MAGRRADVNENHFNILKQYINTAAKTSSGESLNAIAFKIRRRRQIPGKNMITLTNILNETCPAVLKVIQGPLPSFFVCFLFFTAPERSEDGEEKTGPELFIMSS